MPKLLINEYAVSNSQALPAPIRPTVAKQALEIGADEAVSEPFSPQTRLVEIKAQAPCAIDIAATPKADPELDFMDAGERLFFTVQPGLRVAVVASDD